MHTCNINILLNYTACWRTHCAVLHSTGSVVFRIPGFGREQEWHWETHISVSKSADICTAIPETFQRQDHFSTGLDRKETMQLGNW